MCNRFAEIGLEPYGLDIEADLIHSAKTKYPELSFICADCENAIPFSDKYFDFVWAGDVIEHIRATDQFLNEANRVLKKGGLFALSTPEHNMVKNVLIALFSFDRHYNPAGFSSAILYSSNAKRSGSKTRIFCTARPPLWPR